MIGFAGNTGFARLSRPRWMALLCVLAGFSPAPVLAGQSAPSEKVDALVVLAHPDDETMIGAYLVRASQDQGRRVAIAYMTNGGSGGSSGPERASALGMVREQEALRAVSALGVRSAWFLGGRDTPSQNVLNSLGHWGHGARLESLVRLIRLTRPDILISTLPAVTIGQNHGDHQAAGVLAVEAFDMAGDASAFPAQLAAPTKDFEQMLEGLSPWQPRQIFFFDDTGTDRFRDAGPTYDSRDVSPRLGNAYWRAAYESARLHGTQWLLPPEPAGPWGSGLRTFIPGKPTFGQPAASDDLFDAHLAARTTQERGTAGVKEDTAAVSWSGPWSFYREFWAKRDLSSVLRLAPELAVRAESAFVLPLRISAGPGGPIDIALSLPDGWSAQWLDDKERSPDQARDIRLEVTAGPVSGTQRPQWISATASQGGRVLGQANLRIEARKNALPF